MTLEQFKKKWQFATLTERSASHEHFLDVCHLLGVPTPAEEDQAGESYTFEKHVAKTRGGKGFADVWKRGHFAWEYKGPERDLRAAYAQLHEYLPDLDNPPLLVVSDLRSFQVHTNFINSRPRVYSFTVAELVANRPTEACLLPPLEVLRALFGDFNVLRRERTAERITEDAAKEFLKLAQSLELETERREKHADRPRVAHFLMRILFCLFADSIGLLPDGLFRDMIRKDRANSKVFCRKLRALFHAMAHDHSFFGEHDIPFFNGGLFNPEDDTVLPLDDADMGVLRDLAEWNWSQVAPAIFGTLFERAFKKEKRKLIGAHYTSPDDINLLIEPVLLRPLREKWAAVQTKLEELAAQRDQAAGARDRLQAQAEMEAVLGGWAAELSSVRVLDPACGSGNFLYLALRALMDLWLEARNLCGALGLPLFDTAIVNPGQLYGIETDFYSHELASIVVWIGYLQWRHEHPMGDQETPILRKLTNIQHADAILRYNENKVPYEPEWPAVDYIVGNPPFVGGQHIRRKLEDEYVNDLFAVYKGRVGASSDFVVYWFEKARAMIQENKCRRAGLISTQAIRKGVSNQVLSRILDSGGIFMAWSDKAWELDGAQVRVSLIAFDDGTEESRTLDDRAVSDIYSNLQTGIDVATAIRLAENKKLAFQGPVKVGSFEMSSDAAKLMLKQHNPNGKSNSEVIKPWINGRDIVDRPHHRWIIDFGTMSEQQAALFEGPFEHLRSTVKAKRAKNNDKQRREHWWRLGRSGGDLKAAVKSLSRQLVTSRVAKHRFFTWVSPDTVPDARVVAFASGDDYFSGILHSRIHQVWFLATSARHGVGNDPTYDTETCFETFPLPWPPGKEPKRDAKVKAIAVAAAKLVELRDKWLNPPKASPEELQKLTLTNLYNKRPQWLLDVHAALDSAVAAAYGWPADLSDGQILERLLALNLKRAKAN